MGLLWEMEGRFGLYTEASQPSQEKDSRLRHSRIDGYGGEDGGVGEVKSEGGAVTKIIRRREEGEEN